MRFFLAAVLVVVGHWILSAACGLSVEAFEENFDGSRPFGRARP